MNESLASAIIVLAIIGLLAGALLVIFSVVAMFINVVVGWFRPPTDPTRRSGEFYFGISILWLLICFAMVAWASVSFD